MHPNDEQVMHHIPPLPISTQ